MGDTRSSYSISVEDKTVTPKLIHVLCMAVLGECVCLKVVYRHRVMYIEVHCDTQYLSSGSLVLAHLASIRETKVQLMCI